MKIEAAKRIQSMSFNRSTADLVCHGVGIQLRDHLLKVYLYPEGPIRKWRDDDLFSFYDNIRQVGNNLATKKGKLPEHDYREWLYHDTVINLPLKAKAVIRQFNKKPVINRGKARVYTEEELQSAIDSAYDLIIPSLAKNVPWDVIKDEVVRRLRSY